MDLSKDYKICAVIPAYNEESNIGEIVECTKKYVDKVFVVDDCSTDKTKEIALEKGAEVISHDYNMGYGGSQKTGHELAIRYGYDFVLQLDADGQHDPDYIPILLNEALTDKYDLVLGSRFLNNSYKNYSFVRKIGIKFFTFIVNVFGGCDLTDVTSGFKIYNVNSLKKLSSTSNKHPAVEQMLEIALLKMKVKEISIKMPLRKSGKSHLNIISLYIFPFRMAYCICKVLIRFIFYKKKELKMSVLNE